MARILIIDDSDSVRGSLALTLEFRGHEVIQAEDGAAGLDLIRQKPFDLVFCDLAMPGLNGLEVIRQVRKEPSCSSLPLIVLSAEEREEKSRAMVEGATAFVDKPFLPKEIFAVLDRWLKV